MNYAIENFPYDLPAHEMTPGALKKLFAAVMEQLPKRIACISNHLYDLSGVMVLPSSTDDDLDKMPAIIAANGCLVELSDEEFEQSLANKRPQVINALRAVMSRKILHPATNATVFDAALLWGEAYRLRYPSAQWVLAHTAKTSVDYGDPVLVGTDKFRTQFGPRVELYGRVGCILGNNESGWSLSKLMKMRAFTMGYGPDPRPGPMPDWERKIRGLD